MLGGRCGNCPSRRAAALPGEFGAGCGPAGGLGPLLLCAAGRGADLAFTGGHGLGDERGLPVTPSANGMRARKLAWRGDLDLRVASNPMIVAGSGLPGPPAEASSPSARLRAGPVVELAGVISLAGVVDPLAQVPIPESVRCVHARADDRVPFKESVTYVEAATAAGQDAQLLEVDGGHFSITDICSRHGRRSSKRLRNSRPSKAGHAGSIPVACSQSRSRRS